MEKEIIITLVVCVVAIGLGIVLGNGAVYIFNHLPGKWLVDYGEEPDEELLHPTMQRVRSIPWKYVFTGLFIALGIYLGIRDWIYAIPAIFAIWLLLEMAIADIKYMVVPDQLILLLLVVAIGFIPEHGIKDMLLGAGLGLVALGLMALLSKIIYKKPGIGGADVKLYVTLGLIAGTLGIIEIFVISTLISAIHLIILLAKKKVTLKDKRPMIPYIAIAATVYIVFLNGVIIHL